MTGFSKVIHWKKKKKLNLHRTPSTWRTHLTYIFAHVFIIWYIRYGKWLALIRRERKLNRTELVFLDCILHVEKWRKWNDATLRAIHIFFIFSSLFCHICNGCCNCSSPNQPTNYTFAAVVTTDILYFIICSASTNNARWSNFCSKYFAQPHILTHFLLDLFCLLSHQIEVRLLGIRWTSEHEAKNALSLLIGIWLVYLFSLPFFLVLCGLMYFLFFFFFVFT